MSKYRLHYDGEAEASATFCSAQADEIVTARNPDHSSNVVLDLAAIDRGQGRNREMVWSIRMPLVGPLKKPGLLGFFLRGAKVRLHSPPPPFFPEQTSSPESAAPAVGPRCRMRLPTRASGLRRQFRRQPAWSVLPDPVLQRQ